MSSGLIIVTSRPGMRGVHWDRFPPRLCRKCWAQLAIPRDAHERFTREISTTFELRAPILEVPFKTGAIDQKRRFREIHGHRIISPPDRTAPPLGGFEGGGTAGRRQAGGAPPR